ncbi:MAG: clostripain-related cysteine peptidase, partial [Vulcanimicrobiota bacterium]
KINKSDKKSEVSPPEDQIDIGKQSEKELTVLYYMHGQYDDIGKATAQAMLDLEKAGTDENVNLIAQLGRNPAKIDDESTHVPIDGDWAGVRRYEIRQDSHADLEFPVSDWHNLEKKMPRNPVLYYVLGDEYWSTGDRETGMKYFDKSKELGMVDYIQNYDSDKSKKIRDEFNKHTAYMDEAMADKKVYGSKLLEVLDPSIKMKDPAGLQDFVSWGMQKYPARHYMLVIMGHGGAWMGAAEMSPDKMGDAIVSGVKDANEKTGKQEKLDATIFNSCYMGNVESALEMKDAADISLISENYATTGIFDDWSSIIGNIQKNLKKGQPFNAKKFASDMVETYRQKGKDTKEIEPAFAPWRRDYLTLSAVDNKKLGKLVDAWKNFNNDCKKYNVTDKQLFTAVKDAKNYPSGAYTPRQVFGFYDQIRDLGSIMDNVGKTADIPETVKKSAQNVKRALKDVIINEQHEGIDMEGSQGLTIWGPTNAVDMLFMGDSYSKDVPEFSEQTGWKARLQEAYDNVPKPIVNGFLDAYRESRQIKQQMKKEGITEAEKARLQKKLEAAQDKAVEMKKKMDFTIEHKDGGELFKWETPLDTRELGNIIDEFRKEIPRQDGMGK